MNRSTPPPAHPGAQVACALAQLRPALRDKEFNLKRAEAVIQAAALNGAQLIVFPELFLTGYFLREQTRSLAEDAHGPSMLRLAQVAREAQAVVLIGFAELGSDAVYNALAVINADGAILGTYRKTHLYGIENDYFAAGDTFPVFKTAVGPLGAQICFDLEFPETARLLALNGARIIVCSSANMTPFQSGQSVYLRARALENQVFHLLVNRVGIEEETYFFGGSGIAGPTGQLIVELDDQEHLAYAAIRLAEIDEARASFYDNYMMHRRPELYDRLRESKHSP